MRRILALTVAVLASITLSSCGDDCPVPDDPETPVLFQTDPSSLLFGSDDPDAQAIFVAAMNVSWKAEVAASAQEWLKISEESKRISVRVEENITEQPRTGTITITPDNETLSPAVITVTQSPSETLRVPMHLGVWTFWGDSFDCGFASHTVTLGGGDGIYNEESGMIEVTNGYALILELLSDDVTRQDYQTIEVKPGTYNGSMDPTELSFLFEKWSFLQTVHYNEAGHTDFTASWIMKFSDGYCVDNIELTGGRIEVEETDGGYRVAADLITNRNERVIIEYTGPFDDIRNNGSHSTYPGDAEITGLTAGNLILYGEEASSPGTYSWLVALKTPKKKDGADVTAWLNSSQENPGFLDTGEYVFQKAAPYGEFTAQAGYVTSWGMKSGTWVYEYDGNGKVADYAPLIEGTLSVVYNGGDNYTITAEAFMDNYYTMNFTFEGDLDYTDLSAAGFKGVPYKMDNSEIPDLKIPDRNDRSVRYGLKNIDNTR